jgi:predicted amidohydrolase YtcJ
MHPDGTPIGGWRAEEAVDGRTALRLYTAGGAWAGFQEGALGQVAPGFRADLVVLDGDPTSCASSVLLTMEVRLTISGGRIAWSAD